MIEITAPLDYNYINETLYREAISTSLESLESDISSVSQMGNSELSTSIMSRAMETGRNIPVSTMRHIPKHKITTVTATPYTHQASDQLIFINTAVASVVNLLSAAGRKGRQLIIKRNGSATGTTIAAAGAETIDGAASIPLAAWASTTLVSDGTNWITI